MVWFVVVLSQYVYNSFGITPVVLTWRHQFGVSQLERRGEDFRRHAGHPSQVQASGKASCIRIHPPLKNRCPFTPLLAATGPRSPGFRPIIPDPHPSHISFCSDTPSASLLSVLPHTTRLFLPYPVPVPRFRFHSRFCSRSNTCLHPVPAPVYSTNPRPYSSSLMYSFLPRCRPLPSIAG